MAMACKMQELGCVFRCADKPWSLEFRKQQKICFSVDQRLTMSAISVTDLHGQVVLFSFSDLFFPFQMCIDVYQTCQFEHGLQKLLKVYSDPCLHRHIEE